MSYPAFDAVFYVEEPPEIELGPDGMFHIIQTYRKDGMRIERVMRPHTFMLALRRAAEAARKHRMGGAAIIEFPKPDGEAASA